MRYYADLAIPFGDVDAALTSGPERWLPGVLKDAEDRGTRLLAAVGFSVVDDHRAEKEVEVVLGAPYRSSAKTALPISWTASGSHLFPTLEGDLEIAALGENRTQLALSATYRPPLGVVGRMLDRALLHRVAEATVKDFVDRLAERVGASTQSRTT